jgi:hypothetical protein
VSFSSSRSAMASEVWAFLNAWILIPSLGFNAKLRLYKPIRQAGKSEQECTTPDRQREQYCLRY